MKEGATNQAIGSCPDETWLQYASPEGAGYSSRLLEEGRDAFNRTRLSTLLVIHNGVILLAEGQVNRRFECRSIRKSFLSDLSIWAAWIQAYRGISHHEYTSRHSSTSRYRVRPRVGTGSWQPSGVTGS